MISMLRAMVNTGTMFTKEVSRARGILGMQLLNSVYTPKVVTNPDMTSRKVGFSGHCAGQGVPEKKMTGKMKMLPTAA